MLTALRKKPLVGSGCAPLHASLSVAKGKPGGCLSCPVLPTVNGVAVGSDYVGTYRDKGATCYSHRMKSAGPHKARVLFVFDNPDPTEDRTGNSFQGRDYKFLVRGLDLADFAHRDARFVYAVRCHVAGKPSDSAIKSCNVYLAREIEACDPDVIVPVGAMALRAVVGPSYNVSSCAGSPFENVVAGRKRTIYPIQKPAWVFMNDSQAHVWQESLNKLSDVLAGQTNHKQDGLGKYKRLSAAEAVDMLNALPPGTKLSFDYETNALDPRDSGIPVWEHSNGVPVQTDKTEQAKISIVSWSVRQKEAFYVLRDHVDSDWDDEDRVDFDNALRRVLGRGDVLKLVWNGMFEFSWSLIHLGVRINNFVDVMLVHHQHYEDDSHALDNAATQFTGMGNWKQKVIGIAKFYGFNYAAIPVDVIGPYAGADADATLRIYDRVLPKLDKRRRRLATVFYSRLIPALSDMQCDGAIGDPKFAVFFEKYSRRLHETTYRKISEMPKVSRYVRKRRRRDITDKGKTDFDLNLNSSPQVQDLVFTEFGREPIAFSKKTKKPSANKDALTHYKNKLNCEFSTMLLDWRMYSKQHSTYAVALQKQMHKFNLFIRGNFRPGGTKTGRLSSSAPNLQNQPPVSRRLYVSRFGRRGCLLQADFSQVEVRVAASLAGEEALLLAYRNGIDVHKMTMQRIFAMSDADTATMEKNDKGEYKKRRTIAKRIVFGVLYGIGAPGIVVALRKEGVYVSEDEAQDYINKFFDTYQDVDNYLHETVPAEMKRLGYARNPMGRRRHLPDVRSGDKEKASRALRQGPNAIIQSAASDLTLTSLILINEEFRRRRLASRLVLTVHDSIIADCLRSEVRIVARIIKHIMENVPKLSASLWGDAFDWSWLKCPIVSEIEIGVNWRDTVAFDVDSEDPYQVERCIRKSEFAQMRADSKMHEAYTAAAPVGVDDDDSADEDHVEDELAWVSERMAA